MSQGRIPACAPEPLAGNAGAAGGFTHTGTGQDAINLGDSSQQPIGGNRCGHDPHNFKTPKFHTRHARRPHAIEESKRRVQAALGNIYKYPGFTRVFFHNHKNAKGVRRYRRSEYREGCIGLALQTLLDALNLGRMACGFYDNQNRFHYYDCSFVVKSTDQNESRVKRQFKILQELEILQINTFREQNNDGSWRTTHVQIEFTDKIFEMLELMDEFLADRDTSKQKFYVKQSKLEHNRAKKQMWKKPKFTPKPKAKLDTAPPQLNIDQLAASVLSASRIPPTSRPAGHSKEIAAYLNQLVRQGVSHAEAFKIAREKFKPPPH